MNFLDAFDETGFKLATQALKPINTFLYGVQDLERQLSGRPELVHMDTATDTMISHRAREFLFSELVAVHVGNEGGILQLEDSLHNIVDLPLFAAPLGAASCEALADGFRSALANAGNVADWTGFKSALRTERQAAARCHFQSIQYVQGGAEASSDADGTGSAWAATGQRVLEVFEVERWSPATGEWTTAFLPIDRDLSWRWVDATGCRHPHMVQHLARQEIVGQTRPPCRLDTLFHSTSDWLVDFEGADKEGWRYGVAWSASTWDSSPGLLDALRRRRWTRTYS
jgi:hypothetical protein